MPFTAELSEQPDLDEVRNHLSAAGDYLYGLERVDTEQRTAESGWEADVDSAVRFIYRMDATAQALERASNHEDAARQAIERMVAEGNGGPIAALARAMDDGDTRTVGERVVDRDEYRDWRNRGGGRVIPEVDLGTSPLAEAFGVHAVDSDGRSIGTRQASTEQRALLDSTTGGVGLLRPVATPTLLVPQGVRRQRFFLRDVVPTVQTGLTSIPYIRELNALTTETGAATVGEAATPFNTAALGLKPEATMTFEAYDAPIRKIAAWIPITEEILMDAPTLRGYIDSRLAYMLAVREEIQLLNGNGTAPNLRGIRQTVGIQTQGPLADDGTVLTGVTNFADFPQTIAQAIGKIENVDGAPDAVVVNPLDFWKAVAKRHATSFDNSGSGNAPSAVANITWGLTPIRSRGIEQGAALAGDFGLGATIFDRMQTTIKSTDSHADYFITNRLVILAEERVGLAVHRPDFFVEVDLVPNA